MSSIEPIEEKIGWSDISGAFHVT
ncbi:hypothetical protein R2601_04288 [Salipiger bermudensis HTCC2601]|uniref:Uncharacterized protein n=1 Tax=Salipiger bermudensis (strain DSM 26914 / JCM 13377 / KCTC 12554 / HTCC2601) TaxID=314265 RepID=Q0FVY8_SALBH|nr:hypothetical protein R2601_04288 [Salipiger bermudensis HTCC2601]